MKKSELRKIIKEELGVVMDYGKSFMTEKDWEAMWMDKLADQVHIHQQKEEKINEAIVSYDTTEIAKRAKPLFVLLGKNQGNKGKLVVDIYNSLQKHSSLPTQAELRKQKGVE